MTLYESIVLEIEQGQLPRTLRATDLLTVQRKVLREGSECFRVGFDFYSDKTIRSEFSNHEQGTGFNVRAGRAPRYVRLERGCYQVFALTEDDEYLGAAPAMTPPAPWPANLGLEARMAWYLAQQPFQIHDRKHRRLHPPQPVTGLQKRLDAYFWPGVHDNYKINAAKLSGYVSDACRYASDMQRHKAQIYTLFDAICGWGGVRVPTSDPDVVVGNLGLAAKMNRHQPASMNSAWTKLYAMFYPSDFLIFDSRVATAFVSIAEAVMSDDELLQFQSRYPALGRVTGRGGTRPRATRVRWRNGYACWRAQLDANALGQKMLDAINAQADQQYTLRELEAMLFMEGY
ncbi:hypothetical protein P0Y43_18470 [Pseudomonas entomophila]|uniref:hypothetical protein n=1 Tax=Pseudomonas entomophila TaxID=312306 RepID=UPI0023D86F60|nr:hypothetical protein [Pseudomonas entomophila]MDF0732675.1 hypothetical protein [Pseudomonas entomophila]